jgi:hypothetical protein
VRIGIVQDSAPSGDDVAAVFEKEIRDLLEGEYTIRFPDAMRLQADWTMAGVKAAMDRLLASRQVDMILALGVFASHDAARRRLTDQARVCTVEHYVSIYGPIGLVVAGGLCTSTVLTLLLLPAMYALLGDGIVACRGLYPAERKRLEKTTICCCWLLRAAMAAANAQRRLIVRAALGSGAENSVWNAYPS